MKKYLVILLFLPVVMFSQSSATYDPITDGMTSTGMLGDNPFTIVLGDKSAAIEDANLSQDGFEAEPLGNIPTFNYLFQSNSWTITFDQPVTDLRLYCVSFKTGDVSFDRNFTILSGQQSAAAIDSNTLRTSSSNVILEFPGTYSTLTLTETNALEGGSVAIHFATGEDPSQHLIYNTWYLHEMFVRGAVIPIPDIPDFKDGILMPVSYRQIIDELSFPDQKAGYFEVNLPPYANMVLSSDVEKDSLRTYAYNGGINIPPNTSEEVLNFIYSYNVPDEEKSFFSGAKFVTTTNNQGMVEQRMGYMIEGEGTDMKLKIINEEGETLTYGLVPHTQTSISNSELVYKTTIYPNPTQNSFNIDLPDGFDTESTVISIINVSGHVVKQHKGKIKQLDISNLKAGVYAVVIKNGKKVSASKLIKE